MPLGLIQVRHCPQRRATLNKARPDKALVQATLTPTRYGLTLSPLLSGLGFTPVRIACGELPVMTRSLVTPS